MIRTDIINSLIDRRGYTRYVEIGVACGSNLNSIRCPYKLGVDPDFGTPADIHMTSAAFFSVYGRKADIIFIDGLHLCETAYTDILNAQDHLNPGGVVVIHDVLPENEEMASRENRGGPWTGDVWKAVATAYASSPYACYTVDTDYGVGIIDSSMPHNMSEVVGKGMAELTYADYTARKKQLLNIITEKQFSEFVLA